MRERYGEEREAQFYDMPLFGAGVTVLFGTDLPLFIPLLFLTRCMPPAVVQFPDGSP